MHDPGAPHHVQWIVILLDLHQPLHVITIDLLRWHALEREVVVVSGVSRREAEIECDDTDAIERALELREPERVVLFVFPQEICLRM